MTTRKKSDPSIAKDELAWLEEMFNGPLINLHLVDIVEGAAAVQEGRAKEGKEAAKARTEWHQQCIEDARDLIVKGCEPNRLVGKIVQKFEGRKDPHNAKTIREILKKAGLLPKKEGAR